MVHEFAASERFRVGDASAGGIRLVNDRGRSELFWVYPTMTPLQELHGHERGSWYFKPLIYGGNRPVSIPYPSFEAALQGLRDTQQFKDLTGDEAARTPRPH